MPYEWVRRPDEAPERSGASSFADPPPVAELHLWPYRSLPRKGYVIVIGGMAALLALPLLAVLGTPVLWGLLPFALAALASLWFALSRSYRDGEMMEVLRLWPDRVTLDRSDGRMRQHWQANPHWVEIRLHADAGPVPNYVTLNGSGREVEIGAFLTEEERLALLPDLRALFGGRPAVL